MPAPMEMMDRETSIVDDFFQDRQSDREASTLRDALRITSGPTRITRRARQLLARQILASAQRYETATPFFVIWRRFALTLIFWATLLDVGNLGILYVAIWRRSGDLERALLDDDDDATLVEAVPVTISDPDFEHRKLVRLE